MRILTALEQVAIWHAAMPMYYHVTDNPDFKPDPNFTPSNMVLDRPGVKGPGLFVAPEKSKDSWAFWRGQGTGHPSAHPRGYRAELWSDEDLETQPGNYEDGGEVFVPARNFNQLQLKRVSPYTPGEGALK